MTGLIARKEFRDLVRDGRFRVLALLVMGIAVLALGAGWRHHREVERQHTRAREATRAQWLEQGRKNPHAAAHYGVYAFKPKTTLSLVDTGVEPYVGVAAWLEAHRQNEFKYRPAQDRTSVQRFGELTAAQGLLLLMPLFIVLVSFGAFSGEREQGTLRAVLSLGVRMRDLAAGKVLGAGAALALVGVPAASLAVVGLLLASGPGGLWADLPRAALMSLAFAVYFTVFFAVSLAASARLRSSRIALIVLLAFWFLNSLVVPRVAADVAAALHPTPTSVEFQRAMQADLDDRAELERRLDERRRALMVQHGVSTASALPVNFRGISLQEGERHGNEVFDRHYGGLFRQFERQESAARVAGVLAPFVPVRAIAMALAGTDVAHHRDFVTAAEQYRRRLQDVMNEDITLNSRDGVVYEADASLWARVPPFDYQAPAVRAVLAAHAWDLALLALWALASVTAAARAIVTMPVD